MDMEKIMAYVEKIAENLEGLVCAIGCDSMPSDGAIYVDGEQKVNYISTREALRILDGFGNNSASVMIGKSDYILIYDASRKLVIDGEAYLPSGYLVMKSCNGLQAIDDEDFADVIAALKRSRILVVCGSAVDDTVLTDIAIANRFHVASSTMRGVLGVDKNKKEQ